MWKWLVENEEWFALGLGIIAVTALVGIVARWMARRSAAAATPPAPVPGPVVPQEPAPMPRNTPSSILRPELAIALPSQPRADLAVLALQGTRPRLQEVLAELRRAPATQRDDLIDSFLGYPVTCAGEVKSAVKLRSGKLLIDLATEDGRQDVFFEVHPTEYPQLELASAGTRIVASGRFRCSASVVWLDGIELAPEELD
ncbi:MAG: hypothetical protein ABI679_13665 [Gemmatimonadota bacterium]